MADDYESPTLSIFRAMNNYGAKSNDYQTTMAANPAGASDYDNTAHEKWCALMDLARVVAVGSSDGRARVLVEAVRCKGPRCVVLSIARNK